MRRGIDYTSPWFPWLCLAAIYAFSALMYVTDFFIDSAIVAFPLFVLTTALWFLFPLALAIMAEMMRGSLAFRLANVFAAAWVWAGVQTIITRTMNLLGEKGSMLNMLGTPTVIGLQVVALSLVVIGLYRLGYARPRRA